MSKIVISYRRSDSDVFAGRIRDRIVDRYGPDSVFMDIDDIPFGKDFRQHIKDALAESDAIVVIIGPRWLGPLKSGVTRIHDETDPVRIEVETALQRGIPILPVLEGDTKMPKPAQLPNAIRDFAFINAAPVDTGRDFHPHMDRLLRDIDKILGAKGVQPMSEPVRHARATAAGVPARRIAAGLAVVVVAGVIGASFAQLSKFLPVRSGPVLASADSRPAPTPILAETIKAGPISIPGLNCAQPESMPQRTICENEDLAIKHRQVIDLYDFLQSRWPNDERLKADQAVWRKAIDDCEGAGDGMYGCINNANDKRIANLKIGPSYPCQTDKGRVEQAICKDALLSTKDKVMQDLYDWIGARTVATVFKPLRAEQISWLKGRNACDDPDMVVCINRVYDERFPELDKFAATVVDRRPPPATPD